MQPDQTQPGAETTTPQESSPVVSPQTLPQETPGVAPTPPMGGSPAPQKSKTGLIVGIVIAVVLVLLLIFGVVAFTLFKGVQKAAKSASDTATTSKTTKSNKDNNAVTADSDSDYDVVCDGGTVKNAAAATAPYKIKTFYNNDLRDYWSGLSVGYGESYYPDYKTPEDINVVACLKAKSGTAVKEKTCDFKSSGEQVTVDYYSLQYELAYYAAKTGKKISSATTSVAAPATSCPYVASISSDNKLYASPDDAAIEAAHKALAAR